LRPLEKKGEKGSLMNSGHPPIELFSVLWSLHYFAKEPFAPLCLIQNVLEQVASGRIPVLIAYRDRHLVPSSLYGRYLPSGSEPSLRAAPVYCYHLLWFGADQCDLCFVLSYPLFFEHGFRWLQLFLSTPHLSFVSRC